MYIGSDEYFDMKLIRASLKLVSSCPKENCSEIKLICDEAIKAIRHQENLIGRFLDMKSKCRELARDHRCSNGNPTGESEKFITKTDIDRPEKIILKLLNMNYALGNKIKKLEKKKK